MSKQPEALRVADMLESAWRLNGLAYESYATRLLREQHAEIQRLRAAVLAEREACARIAEQYGWSGECRHVAAAIRARGE